MSITIKPILPATLDIESLKEAADYQYQLPTRGLFAIYADTWFSDGFLKLNCLDIEPLKAYLLANGYHFQGIETSRYSKSHAFKNGVYSAHILELTGFIPQYCIIIHTDAISIYPHEFQQ